ncbi:MAG: chromosome segregation protein SMC [Blautia sp.]|jgi:chromosome segregation protein
MYLKSIEVQGFKSFAQKIVFEFHNGITGIVGPNGSGKSNVGDAVRWVLGEQSAKQLRGGNMQDVIFSGTENRKPLSFASVAITLDNSDHQLAIEYEEVTVTRRLYRSGESEYLINGSSCRLKDINELFYDTGIGKEGYSIIGQGQIDKILSGKPEERRELFDEAAGIVKFKRRKNTALKKLEEEKQNLVRVTDILSELTRQLGPLEKQSETAKIYLGKKEELKILDVNMFLLDMERMSGQLTELQEKQSISQEELEKAQESFETTKQEYDRLEQALEELEEKMTASRERAQENTLRKQQLESQVELFKEQIKASRQSDEHYQARIQVVEEELAKRQEELESHRDEKAELQAQIRLLKDRQKKAEIHREQVTAAIEECTKAVEDGKGEIIEILNSRATTKGKVQRFDAMMEQVNIRKAELSKRMLHLKSEEAELAQADEKAREEYAGVTRVISDMEKQTRRLDDQVTVLQETIKKQNEQMDVGQTAYHREASRLESLRNLTERYDGYGNSIRRVMEQKDRVPGIQGVVADLIQVDKNYETAIETALGGSIQNIVTDDEQTAKRMIEYLKKNRYGRATFLPLTNIRNRSPFTQKAALSEPGVIGLASTLVKVKAEHEDLAQYLLGRTLVVDHIDHAIAIGRKYKHTLRMVTVEGESLNPGGSMTGGAFKNTSNLLGRRREIEELEDSVKRLKAEVEQMQASIDENRKKRNVIRDTISEMHEKLQAQYILQNTSKMNLVQLEEKKKEITDGYQRIRQENQEIEEQIQEITDNHKEIQKELDDSKQDEKELETFIETRQQELDEYKEEETACSHELEEIRMESAGLLQKEEFQREHIQRLEQEIERYAVEQEEISRNLGENQEEIQRKENNILEIQKTIAAAAEVAVKEAALMENYQKDKEEMNVSHKSFFDKRDELSGQINLLDKECYRLGSQIEKLEENKEQQIAYMWEEYEITPNSALSLKREEMTDLALMKKQIAQLKDSIRKLGEVNVNAIEDYKELLERHTFLSGQHEDLVKAEATLMDIIEELDAGMRKQFSEKFYEIQREFDKAFKDLFGGGKGTLELMEDEDILEAGIKIISQPPGKKLQNMMQLSGGEKALTAIALLFAIQNLKPSPFCLLDEIEAALDDSNVTRFADYLQKLTKNTQFIIITHRRGTMRAADRLYGITMQEKGVSTLVSVDLVEKDLTK